MKKYLEKNYKWVVRALVIVWMFFILKLFLEWSHLGGCGGWWISICIVPSLEYYWISASYIAVLFLWISIYLITRIKKIDNKMKKVQIAFLIFVLWLIWRQVFFLVSPDFKFYLNVAEYKDEHNNLVDIDKYLEQVNKYCINDDKFNFYQSREDMCGGKFEPDLKTVDEYIKVFESANKNNNGYLYYLTYRFADENVGLENIIEKYNDDTFYAYSTRNWSNEKVINSIKEKSKNNQIISLVEYINNEKKSYFEQNKIEGKDKYDNWNDFRDKIEKELKNKIKQIPEINNKIF